MRRQAFAAVALLVVAASAGQARAETSSVRGELEISVSRAALRGLGPIVVYLDPIDTPPLPARALPAVRIEQRGAAFSPAFQVVSVGQTLDMPNADVIYHNVFSYSRPNDFDLGMYPAGESRAVRFDHPGVVKVYCSIHESMNATIVVAPTPLFAVVHPDGHFVIEDVPSGRYRLRTWCEKLPEISREISVEGDTPLSVSLSLRSPG